MGVWSGDGRSGISWGVGREELVCCGCGRVRVLDEHGATWGEDNGVSEAYYLEVDGSNVAVMFCLFGETGIFVGLWVVFCWTYMYEL